MSQLTKFYTSDKNGNITSKNDNTYLPSDRIATLYKNNEEYIKYDKKELYRRFLVDGDFTDPKTGKYLPYPLVLEIGRYMGSLGAPSEVSPCQINEETGNVIDSFNESDIPIERVLVCHEDEKTYCLDLEYLHNQYMVDRKLINPVTLNKLSNENKIQVLKYGRYNKIYISLSGDRDKELIEEDYEADIFKEKPTKKLGGLIRKLTNSKEEAENNDIIIMSGNTNQGSIYDSNLRTKVKDLPISNGMLEFRLSPADKERMGAIKEKIEEYINSKIE